MTVVPDRINAAWISALADDDLVDVEALLHEQFETLDRRHKQQRGNGYVLLRGPVELIDAWDRWSRVSVAARARSLRPRRGAAG